MHLLVAAGAARGSADDREQLLPSEAVRAEPEHEPASAVADEAPQFSALLAAAEAPHVVPGAGEVRAEPEPEARAVAEQKAAQSPAPWAGADVPERRVGHKARAEASVDPGGSLAPRRAKCEAPEEAAPALGATSQEDEEPEMEAPGLAGGGSPAAAPARSASRGEPVLESLAQFAAYVATARATSGPNATLCLYIVLGVVGALFLVASYCLWCTDRVRSLPERAEEFVTDPLPRPRETRAVRATKRLSKQLSGAPRLSIDERRVSIDERAVVADEGS